MFMSCTFQSFLARLGQKLNVQALRVYCPNVYIYAALQGK